MNKSIKKYTFNQVNSPQIEVVSLPELMVKHKRMLTQPHRTNFYHIFFFEKCNPTHTVDFTPIKINCKSLLFINKNCVHFFDTANKYRGKVIIFTDEFFCKTQSDSSYLYSSILFNDLLSVSLIPLENKKSEFDELILKIEQELSKNPDKYQYDLLKNYLQNIMLLAERFKHDQGFKEIDKSTELELLLSFKKLLEENYCLIKEVKRYAKLLGTTQKQLSKATQKILDMTPKKMIDDRVILEAKRLLTHTNQSVKEISFLLGFDEPTNFNKYFHKHLSCTPIEFRQNYLF